MIDQPSILSDLVLLSLLLGGSAGVSLCVLLVARAMPLERVLGGIQSIVMRCVGRNHESAEIGFGFLTIILIGSAALAAMGMTPWGPLAAFVGIAAMAGFVVASIAPVGGRAQVASVEAAPLAGTQADAKAA